MPSMKPSYVFEPLLHPALPILGSDLWFPVRRIFCVGRNYPSHALEMGGDPRGEPPFFFIKPADAAVAAGDVIYPPATRDLQHEVELVAALCGEGADVPPGQALDLVYGYAVGLDLTRRDLQAEAKRKGRPWAMSKAFPGAAPCSPIRPAASIGHPERGAIVLRVNGQLRQRGDLRDRIWSTAETLSTLSRLVPVQPGDLVFLGTPEGVGPLEPGDRFRAEIEGVGILEGQVRPQAERRDESSLR